MDVMIRYRDEYFKDCEALLEKNHVYKNHVNKFIEYLKSPSVNLSNSPMAIDKYVVAECIGYYHDRGEINSRSTMESHLESIKSFYDYLSESKKEKDIFSDLNYSKYKDGIVKEYGLSEPMERGIYKCEDIEKILICLDDAIDSFESESAGIRDEERHLQRIIIRLFMKITLIAPAKRSVITDIKRSDIRKDLKKILINGIEINVPCGLSRDLDSAIKMAESKNGIDINDNDRIFEFIYRYKGKFRGENLNAWFYNIVQDFQIFDDCKSKKSYAVEPIRNMAIKMMVDNMINPVFISKISGITLSMIESTYYTEDWEVRYEENLNKSINKAIAQNDYYCYI